jgi:hypothetical protein
MLAANTRLRREKLKRPDPFQGISGARAALPQNCPRCVEYGVQQQESSNLK